LHNFIQKFGILLHGGGLLASGYWGLAIPIKPD